MAAGCLLNVDEIVKTDGAHVYIARIIAAITNHIQQSVGRDLHSTIAEAEAKN